MRVRGFQDVFKGIMIDSLAQRVYFTVMLPLEKSTTRHQSPKRVAMEATQAEQAAPSQGVVQGLYQSALMVSV